MAIGMNKGRGVGRAKAGIGVPKKSGLVFEKSSHPKATGPFRPPSARPNAKGNAKKGKY